MYVAWNKLKHWIARRRVLDVAVAASIAASVGGSVCSMGVAVDVEAKWLKAFQPAVV